MSNNLYKIRKKRNLTLRKLASLTGVSPSTLKRVENYETDPTWSIICKISKGLELSVLDIFNCDDTIL